MRCARGERRSGQPKAAEGSLCGGRGGHLLCESRSWHRSVTEIQGEIFLFLVDRHPEGHLVGILDQCLQVFKTEIPNFRSGIVAILERTQGALVALFNLHHGQIPKCLWDILDVDTDTQIVRFVEAI